MRDLNNQIEKLVTNNTTIIIKEGNCCKGMDDGYKKELIKRYLRLII